VISNLKEHYRDPDVARKVTDALKLQQKSGRFDPVDRVAFAALLTATMRDVSHDASLVVIYSEQPLVEQPQPRPTALERYREAMSRQNCTFEQVRILPGNIGYLKLNSFPDLSVCGATATAAMTSVNGAKAVIFDLRDNTGGFPDTVASIAAWLFDHPEYLYNPREETTKRSWTHSPVPGSRLADKPVYILTSARTFSGAEQFAWDLKMLKRATIVGERTRGGAHAGVFHRLDSHFAIGIPEAKPVNPFSDKDWDGIGVEPDVKVNAADALERAEKLAASRLRRQVTEISVN
jgi:C-terminal processing protease CtpA/Prc